MWMDGETPAWKNRDFERGTGTSREKLREMEGKGQERGEKRAGKEKGKQVQSFGDIETPEMGTDTQI